MDIKLPNGTVVHGVPDGTPKDAIMAKAISAGLATESDFTKSTKQPEPSVFDKLTGAAKVTASAMFPTVGEALSIQENPDETRALAQGTSLGFADEIEAGVRAPFSYDDYATIRDDVRQQNQAYKDEHPIKSTALEVAGALPTAFIPAANIARGTGALKTGAKLAAVGAIEGGVTGAGTSNKQGKELLTDVGNGLATGAVLAPLIGGSFNVAAEGLSVLGKALGDSRLGEFLAGKYDVRARNELRKWAKSNDIDNAELDKITNDMRTLKEYSGSDVSLADVDNPYIQALTLGLNKQSSLSPQQVTSLTNRAGLARNNLTEIADPTLAVGQQLNGLPITKQNILPSDNPSQGNLDLTQYRQDAIDTASRKAKPYYDTAYQQSFDSQNINNLVDAPIYQQALSNAQTRAKNETVATGIEPSQVQVLDYTKRELDSMVGEAASDEARTTIMNIRSQLLDEMDKQIPQFAAARQIASKGQQLNSGIVQGRKSLNQNIETTKQQVKTNKAIIKQGMELGLGRNVRDVVDKGQRSHGSLLNDKQLTNIDVMSPNKAQLIRQANAVEQAFNRTANIADMNTSSASVRDIANSLQERAGVDEVAAVTVANFMLDPSLVSAAWATKRWGDAVIPKLKHDKQKLVQKMQEVLYKHNDPEVVNKVLAGELEGIPADAINRLGKTIALMVTPSLADAKDGIPHAM